MPHPDRRRFLAQTVGALTGIAILPDLAAAAPRWQGAPRKVGLIGAGRQGRAIATELLKLDQFQLAAVCDISPGRLRSALERTPGAEGFADHRALLEKRTDIEAVIVATPSHLHRAVVEDGLAAGRHVYCESPLASTLDDCRAMAAAAASAKVVCQVGLLGRSNPVYRRARPLAQTELRELVSGYAQSHRKTSWRFPSSEPGADRATNWRLDPEVSIGLAGELGTQQIDVFSWYRGRLPLEVRGRGAIRHHTDGRTVADTIGLELLWDDGLALRYQATLANSYGGQYEVLHGVNGAIRLAWSHGWLFKEVDAPTQGWEVYATRQQFFQDEGIVLVADATKLAAQGQLKEGIGLPHPPLYYGLADFAASITAGAPVACSAEEGARASIVGILANQAVVTGAPVSIPEDIRG
jgi:predicted dehydrogenase